MPFSGNCVYILCRLAKLSPLVPAIVSENNPRDFGYSFFPVCLIDNLYYISTQSLQRCHKKDNRLTSYIDKKMAFLYPKGIK